MRAIIILAVIALLMGLAGWLTLGHGPGRTSINIETDEIQSDTRSAVEETEELLESGVEALSGDDGETTNEKAQEGPSSEIQTNKPVQPAPVDVDEEPVRPSPTETPVTSPSVAP